MEILHLKLILELDDNFLIGLFFTIANKKILILPLNLPLAL